MTIEGSLHTNVPCNFIFSVKILFKNIKFLNHHTIPSRKHDPPVWKTETRTRSKILDFSWKEKGQSPLWCEMDQDTAVALSLLLTIFFSTSLVFLFDWGSPTYEKVVKQRCCFWKCRKTSKTEITDAQDHPYSYSQSSFTTTMLKKRKKSIF